MDKDSNTVKATALGQKSHPNNYRNQHTNFQNDPDNINVARRCREKISRSVQYLLTALPGYKSTNLCAR